MIKKIISILAVFLLLTITIDAEQKPLVSMETHSYQWTVVKDKTGKVLKDKKGKTVKKWLKATKVVPGDVVKYIDTITNDSDTVIKNAKISNPINQNLIFIEGSAVAEVKFSIMYSVDGGKHYAVPAKLFVIGKDKKKHSAQAKDYNAILFSVDEVPSHSKVDVAFRVRLK